MNYLIQNPDNYSYDKFINKTNDFIKTKQGNVKNNIFTNKVDNNNKEVHKKRMVKNYLLPLSYLIYSKIYSDFYKKQSVHKLLNENALNFNMYNNVFDHQNPIIKKVNIFLDNNLKNNGGNAKKEEVNIQIDNTKFIEFLKEINIYIENKNKTLRRIEESSTNTYDDKGNKYNALNNIKSKLEKCFKSLFLIIYYLDYFITLSSKLDTNIYNKLIRENNTINIEDVINDIKTKYEPSKGDDIILELIDKSSAKYPGFNIVNSDNHKNAFKEFNNLIENINFIRIEKIQFNDFQIALPSTKALTFNNILIFYNEFSKEYTKYIAFYTKYIKYSNNIKDIIEYLTFQNNIFNEFSSNTNNLNKPIKINNYKERMKDNNNMIFFKIIDTLDILVNIVNIIKIKSPKPSKIAELERVEKVIKDIKILIPTLTDKKYIKIANDSLLIANEILIPCYTDVICEDGLIKGSVKDLDKTIKSIEDVYNEISKTLLNITKSEQLLSESTKLSKTLMQNAIELLASGNYKSYYEDILKLVPTNINKSDIIYIIQIFLIILYIYKKYELTNINDIDNNTSEYDTQFGKYKIKFNDIFINILTRTDKQNTNKYQKYISSEILSNTNRSIDDYKITNTLIVTKDSKYQIAKKTHEDKKKNYEDYLTKLTTSKGKIEADTNKNINIAILKHSTGGPKIEATLDYITNFINNKELYDLIKNIDNLEGFKKFINDISKKSAPSAHSSSTPSTLPDYTTYLQNTTNKDRLDKFKEVLNNNATLFATTPPKIITSIDYDKINMEIMKNNKESQDIIDKIKLFTIASKNITDLGVTQYIYLTPKPNQTQYDIIDHNIEEIEKIISLIKECISISETKNIEEDKRYKIDISKQDFKTKYDSLAQNIDNTNTKLSLYVNYIKSNLDKLSQPISNKIKTTFNGYYPTIVSNLETYKKKIISLKSTSQNILNYYYENQFKDTLDKFTKNDKEKSNKNNILACINANNLDKIYFNDDLRNKIKNIPESQKELKKFFNQYENEYCKKSFNEIYNLAYTNKKYIQFNDTNYNTIIKDKIEKIKEIKQNINPSVKLNKYTILPYTDILYMYLIYLSIITDYLYECSKL